MPFQFCLRYCLLKKEGWEFHPSKALEHGDFLKERYSQCSLCLDNISVDTGICRSYKGIYVRVFPCIYKFSEKTVDRTTGH